MTVRVWTRSEIALALYDLVQQPGVHPALRHGIERAAVFVQAYGPVNMIRASDLRGHPEVGATTLALVEMIMAGRRPTAAEINLV